MQHTSNILLIKPVNFNFNEETAVNNRFQVKLADDTVQEKALAEFALLIQTLTEKGIAVTVVNDTPEPYTPDSVFPNNWISFHEDGALVLYPMFAENRRKERKQQVIDLIRQKFSIKQTIDLTHHELDGHFLEGTGSMVLDRENRIAYACLSARTHKNILEVFCSKLGYQPVIFSAYDQAGAAIYHTNVMMCVADRFVVICLESITDTVEKAEVRERIIQSGKQLIEISYAQMNRFAGNMLQVHNQQGKRFLVMSSQAYHSLTPEQIQILEAYQPLLHSDISTIETHGGGSVRCMMAEIFLPEK